MFYQHFFEHATRYRHLLLSLWLACISVPGVTQKVFDLEVSGDYREATMIEMFLDLEQRYPVKFYYDPEVLPYYPISYKCANRNLFNLLQTLLPPHSLVCTAARENGIVICKKTDLNSSYIRNLLLKWDNNQIALPEFLKPLELSLACGAAPAASSAAVVVDAQLTDEKTLEPIVGATVRADSKGAANTDRLGRFHLELAPGPHLLEISYLGYRDTRVQLDVFQAATITIPMQVRALSLATVEIQGNKAANKQSTVATGVELLSTQTIRELPAFMGESDVVKSLLTLPGVSTVGEGTSGFNVRGGNTDQNLVLQDNLSFFNTAHVLGFFSVFNPDLVRSTTLYKGHIPARFGGRAASVLDVKLRDGDFSAWHGSAGAGPAAAKVSLEGPFWKDRVSVLAGARLSYSDWMLKVAKLPEVKQSSAWFNDINIKIACRTSKNGTVTVGGHRSADYFRFAQQFGYQWQTTGATFAWRQTWGNAFLTSLSAAAGRLENQYFQPEGADAFELQNGLAYQSVNLTGTLLLFPRHDIQAGVQWNRNQPLPQRLKPYSAASAILPKSIQQENGAEWAAFAEDEWKISEKITLSGGCRFSFFQTLGPHTLRTYAPGAPFTEATVLDTLFFGRNAASQTYGGPEPRLAFNIRLNGQHALKLSYTRMRQYQHLISNSTAATPTDTWQVSNRYLPPQINDNWGGGWFFTRDNQRWETSVELYYRQTRNVPAYIDFATLLLNDHLETELIPGMLRSYGLEGLARKNKGRWTGWVSYTWSRAWQQARSPWPALSINHGAWFPANFDQAHQLIVFAKYAINPAFYWTFNFTYRSGRPVTAPQNGYPVGPVVVPNFSDRNNLRIPDYHRLDIGLTFDRARSKLHGLKWTLNLSAYNVYSRQNPFSVYFKRDRNGRPKAFQLAVIGSIIPAANLTFYW